MTVDLVLAILALFALPSSIIVFLFWNIQRTIVKKDEEAKKRSEARDENMCMLLKGSQVTLSLAEATAKAVRDQKCNGEMSAALAEACQFRSEREEFLREQSVRNTR